MLWKVVTDGEVYVFCNGSLIYKRWVTRGQSRVFHEAGKI